MAAVLADKLKAKKLYVLRGKNTDTGIETTTTSTFEGIEKFEVDKAALHPVLVECRVIKTEKELELLRFVNKLSSRAHINLMKNIRPGKMEFHAESDFLHYVYSNGGACFHAYTCICGKILAQKMVIRKAQLTRRAAAGVDDQVSPPYLCQNDTLIRLLCKLGTSAP
ncbi:hypothetical protein BBJ29_009967 [Phytophthora kernoviae]|uniref:Uncharacterized protein n=1 Tax=Phytophthora kernoviae TaxID=325452 RepID=A0A3F2RAV8_9STRA|nr:hypothetical protein BBJ29_009967 [Phytophthora kernoviae]RLN50584.1 hypothetical protein BBP00_00010032 [Phytophthora kernoviae]